MVRWGRSDYASSVRIETRLRRIRIWAWVMAPLLTFPLTWVVAMLRAPLAPPEVKLIIGLVASPIAGGIIAHAVVLSIGDLLTARLGTRDERQRRLTAPVGRFTNLPARAAIAFETGDLAGALALLSRVSSKDLRNPLTRLVLIRKALAVGDPTAQGEAIERLFAWKSRMRLGVHAEIARYHAFVLASTLAGRAPEDPQVIGAAKRLEADRDPEIRAYAAWLAPGDAKDADTVLSGAALARASGREPLAQALELRAARFAAGGDRAPYRGDAS